MKTILTKLLALSSLALLLLPSCKKDGTLVTSNGGKPGNLTASATTLVLDKTKLTDANSVINFTFTAPNYGYNAAVTNTLQIDASGDNWANPTSVTLGSKTYAASYSTADFNSLLLKLNLAGGVTSQVNVRVVHTISANVAPVYSNVVNLTVTPFNLTSYLYVVGAFQGWNASAPDSLISATSNNIYTGIINFTTGNNQFLILPQKNSYNNKYATDDAQGSVSATVKQNANNNFYAPTVAGNYLITLNLNNNTIAFQMVNSYSVTGPATPAGDWGLDSDLKYVNDGGNSWVLKANFSKNDFKVRQNHDWGYSWGSISPADGVSLTDSNGGNLSITAAGTYTFTFTIPVSANSMQNPSSVPSVTASYTLK